MWSTVNMTRDMKADRTAFNRAHNAQFSAFNTASGTLTQLLKYDQDFGLGIFPRASTDPNTWRNITRENKELNAEVLSLCRSIVPEFRDSVRKKGKFGNATEWLATLAKLESDCQRTNSLAQFPHYNRWKKAGALDGSFIVHVLSQHQKNMAKITGALTRNASGGGLNGKPWPELGEGKFTCPLILTSSMFDTPAGKKANFPNGIGPRWQMIVDEITRHPDKWESGYMAAAVTNTFPQGFTNSIPFENGDHGIYEVWRVVRGQTSVTDKRDVLMVRVGFSNGLYFDNADYTDSASGSTHHQIQKIGMGRRMHGTKRTNLLTPDKHGREMWEYNDCNMDFDTNGVNKDWMPTGNQQAQFLANSPGNEGLHIFRLQPNLVEMQTKNQNPMALKANFIKVGDYIVLISATSRNHAQQRLHEENMRIKTVPSSTNGNVHDFVITSPRVGSFLHLPQMRVALGRPYHPEHGKYTKTEFPFSSQKAKEAIGNPKKGKVRMFEPMTATELLTMVMGMQTATNEGEIMEAETMEEQKATEFIPTWKDNRPKKTISKTKGTPFFTDVIRCVVCNGRNLVRLPKTPPYENVECAHCGAPEGVITIHLNSESPGVEIAEPQPFR